MNLKKSLRDVCFVLVACVAAIPLLSGCFAQSDPKPETTPVPVITLYPEGHSPIEINVDVRTPLSPPYDEWENWTAGRNEQYAKNAKPSLNHLGEVTGIQGLESPSELYLDQGYAGIAKFGTYCVITVFAGDTEGQIGISIFSRYNNFAREMILSPSHSAEQYRAFTDHFSGWCEGEGWPGFFGNQVDIVIDQPPTNEA